ncbi:DegT/DnrJ/EryC1/StrS aminotransferase family protein [Desulfovibrio sp. JC022]|uniref:DegT/DnrJ/EryC1/StrS family aminotransferase n=1 Tax=Desulfovibrio sp. JC022 TaxID=2593642 RepID=UPI0013D80BDC|nr:DegT/DnrJ/EryC1/StrS family aminotransferase [Desulfovibrio sp. JC022]
MSEDAASAVAEAVRTRSVSMGKITSVLELRISELLDVPHVIACGSGTEALTLALLEAGVGPGDEVVVPDRTWIATAHAPYLLGARPVLVDTLPGVSLMDPDAFAKAITVRTKVVIPVDLNGRLCDMPAIRNIADKHGIKIVSDSTQALFCSYPDGGYAGTRSRSGCFSMSVAKLIPAGQGGFVVTGDNTVADRLRMMRVHGTQSVQDTCWELPGGNFRLTDLHAAIALVHFNKKDELIAGVHSTYDYYASRLEDSESLRLIRYDDASDAIPLYPEVLCTDQSGLLHFLAERRISARPAYAPLHSAAHFGQQDRKFPYADFWGQAVMLPAGPSRNKEELGVVVDALTAWQRNKI